LSASVIALNRYVKIRILADFGLFVLVIQNGKIPPQIVARFCCVEIGELREKDFWR
jgi:hypothetical protein